MNIGYIYKITNLINGKMYVGQTTKSIEDRYKQHIYDSYYRNNKKDNSPLHKAIKKYGKENFIIECIEKCSIDLLNEKEKYWINTFDTFNNGYNATLGGEGTKLLDLNENKIINNYYKYNTILKVAELNNCSPNVISNILKKHNIFVKSGTEHAKENGAKVKMYDINKNHLKYFSSIHNAARWLITNNIANNKREKTIVYNIIRHIWSNTPYLGYFWESDYYSNDFLKEKKNFLYKKQTKPSKKDICPLCNKNEKLQSSTYCVECSQKLLSEQFTKEREQKISREELKQLIRTTPFTKIGEQFGVSDNAIRKWCTRYDLPTKSSEIKKYTNEEWKNI